jgi:hypothetical protein
MVHIISGFKLNFKARYTNRFTYTKKFQFIAGICGIITKFYYFTVSESEK